MSTEKRIDALNEAAVEALDPKNARICEVALPVLPRHG